MSDHEAQLLKYIQIAQDAIGQVESQWLANDGGLTLAAKDERAWLNEVIDSLRRSRDLEDLEALWVRAICEDNYRSLE